MRVKGVVIVPPGVPPHSNGHTPAVQRVANRPIACHAVESLIAAGVDGVAVVAPGSAIADVRVCVESELAPEIAVTYLPQREPADVLGALRAAAGFVGGDAAIVHLADGLLSQHLDPVTDAPPGEAPDLLLLLHRSEDSREALGPVTERVLGVTELGGSTTRLALAGVCRFGAGALRRAAEIPEDLESAVGLVEVAEYLAAAGCTVEAALVSQWRRYGGDPLDLLELNRIVLDQQPPQGGLFDRGDNRIEGRVIIDPTADVRSSIVLGPCIIGPRARVSSSYIGPYTSIGADTEIENAEIVRSIVADGAQIRHISGRIEGSTIGRRASIHRDFGLPRAMRLHVGEDVEVALQ